MFKSLLFAAFALQVQVKQPSPTPVKVLELALEQRRSVSQFAGTFQINTQQPQNKGKETTASFRIWLSGNQLRHDTFRGAIVNRNICRNCEKDGQFIRYHNAKFANKSVYLEYGTMPGNGRAGDPNFRNLLFIDPRVMGLQPSSAGALHKFTLDGTLGSTDRTAPTLEKSKWNGHDVFLVRFAVTTYGKPKRTYYIVPAMDHSVVRVDFERTDDGGRKFAGSLKCDMMRYGKAGIWFPKSYLLEAFVDGKVHVRETMKLTDVTINEPLPANTFRLAGMKLPVGWPIRGSALPNKNKAYEWNGKSPVEEKPAPAPKGSAEDVFSESSGAPRRNVLLAAAGTFAVAGAFALGAFFWKR
jgi:hypothetical protein